MKEYEFLSGSKKNSHVTGVRNVNRYKILKYLYMNGTSTRVEISERLKLSMPTISRNLKPYLGNILLEEGKTPSKAGRHSGVLKFNYSYKKVLAFQVDRDFMMVGLGDLSGNVLEFKRINENMYDFGNFINSLEKELKEFSNRKDVTAVIFGIAGYVAKDGKFQVSVFDWEGKTALDIVKLVKKYFNNVIISFENDANLLAFREVHMSENPPDHLVCIYWGRGLGMGIVANGSIYIGKGMAGEIGMTLKSSKTLEEYLTSLSNKEEVIEEVVGILYNLQKIFDPEAIVLQGKFEKFFPEIRKRWKKNYGNPTRLYISKGGEKAIIQGGICYGAELFILSLTTGLKNLERVWR